MDKEVRELEQKVGISADKACKILGDIDGGTSSVATFNTELKQAARMGVLAIRNITGYSKPSPMKLITDEEIERVCITVAKPYEWGKNHMEEFRAVAQAQLNACQAADQKAGEIAKEILKELEEHNAGWDGLMVNSHWVKEIKKKYGVDNETRELGVNVQPFDPPVR